MQKIKKLLRTLYPEEYSDLLVKVESLLRKDWAVINKVTQTSDWHKNFNLYVTYPDSFCESGKCDLNTLESKIDYLDKLGISAVHILPFFESPRIDAGFDISDFNKVREDLGGNEAFERVAKKLKDNNMKLFIDIVLNHVSSQHEWFQRAINGDEYYRDFFIWRKEKPNFIKKCKDENGVWAEYSYESNPEKVRARIIFPEQAGEIPHWEKAKDGNWYYHTFYPSQIDTNWDNADLFYEFVKVLVNWAKKGVSFRLDAFTFVGKDIEAGKTESTDKTLLCLEVLHEIVKKSSDDSVFLVETCQSIDTIKNYFGTERRPMAELAYNFPLMNAMWMSILLKDSTYLNDVITESYRDLPEHAGWITFLRNHDELTLEFCSDTDRRNILSILEGRGLNFREGFGFSGRTASFLNSNSQRVNLAYMLLVSLPGSPAIIYGDELGKENDYDFMKSKSEEKRKFLKDIKVEDDTRDINRGLLTDLDIKDDKVKLFYNQLSKIFHCRKKLSSFFTFAPELICDEKKSLFVARYENLSGESLYVYINLSHEGVEIELPEDLEMVLEINSVEMKDKKIDLGAYSGVWLK